MTRVTVACFRWPGPTCTTGLGTMEPPTTWHPCMCCSPHTLQGQEHHSGELPSKSCGATLTMQSLILVVMPNSIQLRLPIPYIPDLTVSLLSVTALNRLVAQAVFESGKLTSSDIAPNKPLAKGNHEKSLFKSAHWLYFGNTYSSLCHAEIGHWRYGVLQHAANHSIIYDVPQELSPASNPHWLYFGNTYSSLCHAQIGHWS